MLPKNNMSARKVNNQNVSMMTWQDSPQTYDNYLERLCLWFPDNVSRTIQFLFV